MTFWIRCFFRDRDGRQCQNEGTKPDPESGPLNAMLCPEHYAVTMRRRDENEASWRRAFR